MCLRLLTYYANITYDVKAIVYCNQFEKIIQYSIPLSHAQWFVASVVTIFSVLFCFCLNNNISSSVSYYVFIHSCL